MRLDPVLDAFYVLGSLWGAVTTGPQLCPAGPAAPPRAAHEVTWVSPRRVVAEVTAFVDVYVVPMDTERVLPNQTVLVEGGRITALGPTSQVKVPAGAVRIDGRGKYLMPGLADMHFHINRLTETNVVGSKSTGRADPVQERLVGRLARGVTTIRHLTETPSKSATIREPAGDNITPEQMRRLVETAEVPIPRIYLPAPIPKSLTPDSVTAYVTAAKAAGYRHIGVKLVVSKVQARDPFTMTLFDSLVAAGRRVGLPLAEHDNWLPWEAILALGTTGGSSEHLYTLVATLGYPSVYKPDSAGLPVSEVSMSDLRARAAAAQRAGLWITPTLRCTEKYRTTPTYTKVLRQVVKALQDAGVGMLLSEDDGEFDVHSELTALVRAGLSPYQALVTGTRNPAQFLGVSDSSGTVAVGKWGDLVLLSGNPLQDIQHAAVPAGVMISGRWFDRAALDRHQAALDQSRRVP